MNTMCVVKIWDGSNRKRIIFTIFRLILNQAEFCSFPKDAQCSETYAKTILRFFFSRFHSETLTSWLGACWRSSPDTKTNPYIWDNSEKKNVIKIKLCLINFRHYFFNEFLFHLLRIFRSSFNLVASKIRAILNFSSKNF